MPWGSPGGGSASGGYPTLTREGRAAHPGCGISTMGINRPPRTSYVLAPACGPQGGMGQEPRGSSQTPAEKLLRLTKCFAQSPGVPASRCPGQPRVHWDRGVTAAPGLTTGCTGDLLPATPGGGGGGRRHPRHQTRSQGHQGRPQGGGDASRGLRGGTLRSGPAVERSRLGHRAGDGSRVPGGLVATLQREQTQVRVSPLPAASHVSPCPPHLPLLLTCLRRAWGPCGRAGAGVAGTSVHPLAGARPRAAHPAASPGFG